MRLACDSRFATVKTSSIERPPSPRVRRPLFDAAGVGAWDCAQHRCTGGAVPVAPVAGGRGGALVCARGTCLGQCVPADDADVRCRIWDMAGYCGILRDIAGYCGIWRDMAGYGAWWDTGQIWSDTLKKRVQSRSPGSGRARVESDLAHTAHRTQRTFPLQTHGP